MALVPGKNVILSIASGGAFSSILCNASCTLNIETAFLETRFEDDGAFSGIVPTFHTITLDGNGPVQLGTNYTAVQVTEFQIAKTLINWKFEFDDGTNTAVYSGAGYFTSCKISGDATGTPANVDYTIRCSGEMVINATPPPGGTGTPATWDYTATGGEVTISDPDLVNGLILDVERNGIGLEVITTGTPTDNQVLSTPGTGSLTFGYALGADEYINVLYLE